MKTWDVIVIGGGIIGLTLALRQRRNGHSVLVLDRTEPGREASWAAGGIIASHDPRTPEALRELAVASAELYPEFIEELRDESQLAIDYRRNGTIAFLPDGIAPFGQCVRIPDEKTLVQLEPRLSFSPDCWLLPEASVDPRALVAALIRVCKHRGVEFATGHPAVAVESSAERVSGVRTDKSLYASATVVNCAGAWASQIGPLRFPTRPVKGHMLSVLFQHNTPGTKPAHEPVVQHVIQGPECYVIPRTDGTLIIGSTVEEAGFDKRVDADTIQRLHQSAANLVPEIGEARMHEAWTGLRPGTPDKLPILGETSIPGYFIATGHYRDGIMLAPVTAKLMSALMNGGQCEYDLTPFTPQRFGSRL